MSWKGQVKAAFANPNDYSRFMGSFWTYTGLVSMSFMLLGRILLTRMGYRVAVLFTPLVMALSGLAFFVIVWMSLVSPAPDEDGAGALASAYAGGLAVLVAKAAKYAFFDATKEIIFIPLDREAQSVGKAAIDVVAYRLSKSGGSFILQAVIFTFGSVNGVGSVPVAFAFALVVLTWLFTAVVTGRIIHRAQAIEMTELDREDETRVSVPDGHEDARR